MQTYNFSQGGGSWGVLEAWVVCVTYELSHSSRALNRRIISGPFEDTATSLAAAAANDITSEAAGVLAKGSDVARRTSTR